MSKTEENIIALIDLNFFWSKWEIDRIVKAYVQKKSIKELAKIARRPIDEVVCLIIHLGREGKI